jgi:2-polyprenyl-6-methoxyphenol hydroxylase-like FAD-dependent oxidoreductase
MVDEFDLPDSIIDRKVRNMMMISPTNREVDIRLDNNDFSQDEYIGMCRREVMDKFMRDRAEELGTNIINGLVTDIDIGTDPDKMGPYTLTYSDYEGGGKKSIEVDVIIGADGANSRVAKAMDAGDYNYAIAFQERVKVQKEEMTITRTSLRCTWVRTSPRTSTAGSSRSPTTSPSGLAPCGSTRRRSRSTRREFGSAPRSAWCKERSSSRKPTRFRSTRARGVLWAAWPWSATRLAT